MRLNWDDMEPEDKARLLSMMSPEDAAEFIEEEPEPRITIEEYMIRRKARCDEIGAKFSEHARRVVYEGYKGEIDWIGDDGSNR